MNLGYSGLNGLQMKIRDIEHLEEQLGVAWAALSQEAIDNTISSFRKRVRACVAAEGKRFEYKL